MQRYLRDTTGNLTVVTALTLGLLGMGVGAAVDFNSASNKKAQLQAAVDAGVLAAAVSEEMAGRDNGKTGKAKKIVEAVVAENLPEGFAFSVKVKVKDGRITATGSHDHSTNILQIAGMNTIGVGVESAALIPEETPVHIALVVDTTQSMDGANMTALKTAGNALLDDIDEFSSKAKVSLVPYGQYVNIGTEHEFAPWLDTSRRQETRTNTVTAGCRMQQDVIQPRQCSPTGVTRQQPIISDGTVTGYRTINEQSCTPPVYGSTSTEICWGDSTTTSTVNFTFTGCAGSRNAPNNLRVDASSAFKIKAAMQPDNAAWKAQCGEPLTPLTDNMSKIRNSLNSLTTSGDTYLPAGLMWGWRTLDPRTPFTEAAGADPKTVNAIILMTDGGNTINQVSASSDDWGYHYDKSNNGTAGRQHFDALCSSVKNEDILIFTIGYNLDSSFAEHAASVQSLRNCATSPGHAFTPDNVSELRGAFEDIMLSIRDIRLVN